MLAGANVVLGVSGSIAAVRCVELAHELRRHGASVRAVTTPSAETIIHPWSLEFATERSVVTEITGGVEHVDLCGNEGWADVLLLAPATANTIGKIAVAIDDTPVTTCATTAIGADLPVVVAPAMHEPMWEHPGVLDAIEQLEAWGIEFVPPRLEEGKAKIAADEAIITGIAGALAERTLAGTRIVVTSGPTKAAIDPVRILTNQSSGRMGRAIARACHIRGARVTVVHDGPPLHYAHVEPAQTGPEMCAAAVRHAEGAHALVSAAAIGDFTVDASSEKLDSGKPHRLDLEPAPKLVDAVRASAPDLTIVGFKVEAGATDEELIEAARSLRDRVDAAFVVGNDVDVMGEDETRVIIVDGGTETVVSDSKPRVADTIATRLADCLDGADGGE